MWYVIKQSLYYGNLLDHRLQPYEDLTEAIAVAKELNDLREDGDQDIYYIRYDDGKTPLVELRGGY